MYLPMAGLLILPVWAVAELIHRRTALKFAAAGLGATACLALAVLTWRQTRTWKDSETLFLHAVEVNPGNYLAWDYLGQTLEQEFGMRAEAITNYRTALRLRPDFVEARDSLGRALAADGNQAEALAEFQTALTTDPGYTQARCDLGSALLERGDYKGAIEQFEQAVRSDPASAQAQNDLAAALWRQSGPAAAGPAVEHLDRALELNPAYPLARTNLGLILMQLPGRQPEAVELFNAALQMEPADAAAHLGLARALQSDSLSRDEAASHLSAAHLLVPDADRLRQLEIPRVDDGTAK
jgi:tetratricopeptide (TPR) repeat protein